MCPLLACPWWVGGGDTGISGLKRLVSVCELG